VGRNSIIKLDSTVHGIYSGWLEHPVAGFGWSVSYRPSRFSGRSHTPAWGPWLVPIEEPESDAPGTYLVKGHPAFQGRRVSDLHGQFARLARKRPWELQAPILAFAKRHGWLVSRDERWVLEPIPNGAASDADTRLGEPLSLWSSEIYEFASLNALWNLLRDQRRGELGKYIFVSEAPHRVMSYAAWHDGRLSTNRKFHDDWRPVTYDGESDPVATEGTDRGDNRLLAFPEIKGRRPDVLTATRLYLYDKVSEKLHGRASPILEPGQPPGEALLLQPHSLLAAIYLHFAQDLSGRRAPGVRCANRKCKRTIDPRHGRRYCDDACRDQERYYRDRDKRRVPRHSRKQEASGTPISTPMPTNVSEQSRITNVENH
jgi:hypothetical protein